jgi:hypothetical protein
MIPGDNVKRIKQNEEQELDPFVGTKRSYKHYWIAMWIMSIILALATAFYLFVVLKPSQNNFYAKAIMRLPSGKIDVVDPLYASIEEFLLDHPEYGRFEKTSEMPDWESGKRKNVITSKGKYLFYFKGSKVVYVVKFLPNGETVKIFSEK